MKNTISIIIPALNEQDGIKKTISSIPKLKMLGLGYETEILVVDGDSTDLTYEMSERLGAKVIREKRRGYGRAYKTGFALSRGDIIITLDADATYPAELIPTYVQQLNEKRLDFITINRFSKLEHGSMSIRHMIGNKILSAIIRLLYSIDIIDSQSGMWIMRKNFVDKINLNSDDMSLSEEIKIIAFKNFRAAELEGKYYRRMGTTKINTFHHGWKNLTYLFHYRERLKFAVVPQKIVEKNP